jgi:hypothetical protein
LEVQVFCSLLTCQSSCLQSVLSISWAVKCLCSKKSKQISHLCTPGCLFADHSVFCSDNVAVLGPAFWIPCPQPGEDSHCLTAYTLTVNSLWLATEAHHKAHILAKRNALIDMNLKDFQIWPYSTSSFLVTTVECLQFGETVYPSSWSQRPGAIERAVESQGPGVPPLGAAIQC